MKRSSGVPPVKWGSAWRDLVLSDALMRDVDADDVAAFLDYHVVARAPEIIRDAERDAEYIRREEGTGT